MLCVAVSLTWSPSRLADGLERRADRGGPHATDEPHRRRHQAARLLREVRLLHPRHGTPGARQGPLRLHHGEGGAERGRGAPLLRPGGARRAGGGACRRGAPRPEGREHPSGPAHAAAEADRLRLGCLPEGDAVHRLRRSVPHPHSHISTTPTLAHPQTGFVSD